MADGSWQMVIHYLLWIFLCEGWDADYYDGLWWYFICL